MTDLENWINDGQSHSWAMPPATWWKKLPIIRHVRAVYLGRQVYKHNQFWQRVGIPTGYDQWVLYGIWKGFER